MTVDHIHPEDLGPELGLYSHAVSAGISPESRLVAIAGMLPVDPSGQTVGSDISSQTKVVLHNLLVALRAAGAELSDVISMRTFLLSRADLADFAAARREVFDEHLKDGADPPANTLVFVAGLLSDEHLVEVEALALID